MSQLAASTFKYWNQKYLEEVPESKLLVEYYVVQLGHDPSILDLILLDGRKFNYMRNGDESMKGILKDIVRKIQRIKERNELRLFTNGDWYIIGYDKFDCIYLMLEEIGNLGISQDDVLNKAWIIQHSKTSMEIWFANEELAKEYMPIQIIDHRIEGGRIIVSAEVGQWCDHRGRGVLCAIDSDTFGIHEST